jgi:hypothetical protein
MGQELGRLYSQLWAECAHLHITWGEYVVLFGTSEENLQVLNQAAPAFASMIHDVLWENVLLHLCRLVDPCKSSGKKNLTVRRLPQLVGNELRPAVEQAIGELSIDCAFAKDWRNRRISHADLELTMGGSSEPLAPASRASVKQALEGLSNVLNLVENHYTESTNAFGLIGPARGSKQLLHVLKSGLKAEEALRERLLSGRLLPSDFR